MSTDKATRTSLRPRSRDDIVIFFREGGWYPIQLQPVETLPPGVDRAADIAHHAELNPGTLRVEDLEGNILWRPQ
jgi:hypothetical protein